MQGAYLGCKCEGGAVGESTDAENRLDFNQAIHSPENFTARLNQQYNARNLWDEWAAFVKQRFGGDAEATEVTKASGRKAQPTKDFGPLWKTDEETGLPIMHTKAYLDEKAGEVQGGAGVRAQEWQNMVRQFLNGHYSRCSAIVKAKGGADYVPEAASNGEQSGIPWAKAKSFAVSQWMGEGGWLDEV